MNKRTLIATVAVLLLLGVTQFVIYEEGGWNLGLIMLAVLMVGVSAYRVYQSHS